ncbi:MAG: phosphoribosylaminoimidazolesuccinocarboxamide synthase [Candidatus Moraniibacteriota bacterium]|nr:MAG: phosphoribosylaminoimidazolesuccinocarboxamide synthase [Candidatus Moranbacteria bacterium]
MQSYRTLLKTHFPELKLINRGKVRDLYGIPNHPDKLLFVATDRISAYDVIMSEGIPGKGRVLTAMSLFWFDFFSDISNHLITADVSAYPEECQKYVDTLNGRSMLVKKAHVLPFECIVRGRWTGSYWNAYKKASIQKTESPLVSFKEICGFRFSTDIKENDLIEPPLFTPSTKAEYGQHDENISIDYMKTIIGEERVKKVSQMATSLFERAAKYALTKGIVIADTKFELGEIEGEIVLIDEVLTPDSSRFWPKEHVKRGVTPPSFDKQFLRDYLISINAKGQNPPPELPREVIEKTAQKYEEAHMLLTR